MPSSEQPWDCLHGRYAWEVLNAPNTIYTLRDPSLFAGAHEPIVRMLKHLAITPWSDTLGLLTGICAARQCCVADVVKTVTLVDRGFRAKAWNYIVAEEWNAHDCLQAHLEKETFSGRNWQAHMTFLGCYAQLAYELSCW